MEAALTGKTPDEPQTLAFNGTGTEADPFVIRNVSDLYDAVKSVQTKVREAGNGGTFYFQLNGDITVDKSTVWLGVSTADADKGKVNLPTEYVFTGSGRLLRGGLASQESLVIVGCGATLTVSNGVTISNNAQGGNTVMVLDGTFNGNGTMAASYRNGVTMRYCDTLQNALDNAPAGGTITLLKDIAVNKGDPGVDDTFGIKINKNLTLDLNSHTVTADNNICFTASNNAAVTVKNGAINNTNNYGLYTFGGSTITVENTAVSAKVAAVWSVGTIVAGSGSELNGGTYGLFVVDGGTAIVENGASVTGGQYGINANGGKAQDAKGTVTISGGTVIGKVAAVSATTRDTVAISGGKIDGDLTVTGAGSSLTVTGGEVTGKVTTGEGGTVAVTGGNLMAQVTSTSSDEVKLYSSLKDAIQAAQPGDTVTLLKDDLNREARLDIRKSIILDLNGHTISGNAKISTIMIDNKAIVEIKNGTVENTGN